MDEFVTVADAAKAVGVTEPTLRKLIRDGALTASAGTRGQVVGRAEVHALIVSRKRMAEAQHPEGVEAFADRISCQLWPKRDAYVEREDNRGLRRIEVRSTDTSHARREIMNLPADAAAIFGQAAVTAAAQPLTPGMCRWCSATTLATDAGSFAPANTPAYRALFATEPCDADRERWTAEAALSRELDRERALVAAADDRARAGLRLRTTALDFATMKLGAPYVQGAGGPVEFDCSGLVSWAYSNAAGVTVPRTYSELLAAGQQVPLTDLQPGDLVLRIRTDGPKHVAFYVGGGRVLEAAEDGVAYDALSGTPWTHGLRISPDRQTRPSAPASRPVTASAAPVVKDSVHFALGADRARAQGDEVTARHLESRARYFRNRGQ